MKADPYEVDLAEVAKEVGGDLIIEYHTATIKLTCDQLQSLKEKGLPTNIMSCIAAGLLSSGKTREELIEFVKEAEAAGTGFSISFEAPDGGALNMKSKEENPYMDMLVQAAEG